MLPSDTIVYQRCTIEFLLSCKNMCATWSCRYELRWPTFTLAKLTYWFPIGTAADQLPLTSLWLLVSLLNFNVIPEPGFTGRSTTILAEVRKHSENYPTCEELGLICVPFQLKVLVHGKSKYSIPFHSTLALSRLTNWLYAAWA